MPINHPPYSEMIIVAIGNLKERTGSSRQAIAKYITTNYEVSAGYEFHLKRALKSLVKKKTIYHITGTGASGSFKIDNAKAKKKPKKPAEKDPLNDPKAATDGATPPEPVVSTSEETEIVNKATRKAVSQKNSNNEIADGKDDGGKGKPTKKKMVAKKEKKPAEETAEPKKTRSATRAKKGEGKEGSSAGEGKVSVKNTAEEEEEDTASADEGEEDSKKLTKAKPRARRN